MFYLGDIVINHLNIDAVLCISLEHRGDRRAKLDDHFKNLGLDVEYFLATKDVGNPERGCYTSHRACALKAFDRGYKRVLILEDDVQITPTSDKQIDRINRFLDLRNPEIFFLGGMLGRMWRIPFPGVVRSKLTGGHAYILTQKGMKKLAARPYAGKAIDSVYATEFKGYASYPLFCDQTTETDSESDIAAHREKRKGRSSFKDQEYWDLNAQKQQVALRRDLWRTVLGRWL